MTVDRRTLAEHICDGRLLREPDGDRTLYWCPYCGWNGHIYGLMTHHLTLCHDRYFPARYSPHGPADQPYEYWERERRSNGLYVK